jgi:sugar lactone lactonase YvrE
LGLAVGGDGSLYIADKSNQRIRRVGIDGIITTVAGNGSSGHGGDGGPAIQAQLRNINRIAVGLDGSLYIADSNYGFFDYTRGMYVRRVRPDGIMTTVAGSDIWGMAAMVARHSGPLRSD